MVKLKMSHNCCLKCHNHKIVSASGMKFSHVPSCLAIETAPYQKPDVCEGFQYYPAGGIAVASLIIES